MALTNYGALKTAVSDWLNRADLDQQIPDFIKLAEATLNPVARPDLLTVNHVITYCYGATGGGVRPGERFSKAYCEGRAAKDILQHAQGIAGCIKRDISKPTLAAFIDWAYNLGTAKTCVSTVIRLYNAGPEFEAASCRDISRWVYSGGKDCRIAASHCPGIPLRRADERALCEEGLQ